MTLTTDATHAEPAKLKTTPEQRAVRMMTDGERVAMVDRTRWIIEFVEGLRPEFYPSNYAEEQFIAGQKHMADAVLEKLRDILTGEN